MTLVEKISNLKSSKNVLVCQAQPPQTLWQPPGPRPRAVILISITAGIFKPSTDQIGKRETARIWGTVLTIVENSQTMSSVYLWKHGPYSLGCCDPGLRASIAASGCGDVELPGSVIHMETAPSLWPRPAKILVGHLRKSQHPCSLVLEPLGVCVKGKEPIKHL